MDLPELELYRGRANTRFLLLHGNPGSSTDFAPLLAPLRGLGSVALYDAPGFGKNRTPSTRAASDLDALAAIAVALLDQLGWQDAVLIGHSHGGGVAQRIASQAPKRVRGMALLGTLSGTANAYYRAFSLPGVERGLSLLGHSLKWLPGPLLSRTVQHFMRQVYFPIPLTSECVAAEVSLLLHNPQVLGQMARATAGSPCQRLAQDAHKIRVPTVFVHGDRDQVAPIVGAQALFEQIQASGTPARFERVTGAGHMLSIETPDRCTSAVQWLLDTAGSGPAQASKSSESPPV